MSETHLTKMERFSESVGTNVAGPAGTAVGLVLGKARYQGESSTWAAPWPSSSTRSAPVSRRATPVRSARAGKHFRPTFGRD